MANLTRILSIDGGGIRGIIPGQVLISLENKLKKAKNNDDAHIADYFDLIAGTSTGGILTCLYLCPGPNPGRPKFTADKAVELYVDRGASIFKASVFQKIKSLCGLSNEIYDAKGLEAAFVHYFGDTMLSQLLKPCLVTAYDFCGRKTDFFTQHDAKNGKMYDYYVRDIARATSAAPTYFEISKILSFTGVPCYCIDGGIFANNPALCAYAEVRHNFNVMFNNTSGKNPIAKEMAILSIGTGYAREKPFDYSKVRSWGAIAWIRPLIGAMMDGVSETVDYQLSQMFDAVGCPGQYLRINSELQFASAKLDDVSKENITALQQDGTRIAQNFDKQLDTFVQLL
jgi:uncharacterized protein